MTTRLYRVVGDNGPLARISLTLTDADDQPITSGTVTLRAGGLFEGTMTHDAEGSWYYDPEVGDIDTAGYFLLEAHSDTVTVPAEAGFPLEVRARGEAPG